MLRKIFSCANKILFCLYLQCNIDVEQGVWPENVELYEPCKGIHCFTMMLQSLFHLSVNTHWKNIVKVKNPILPACRPRRWPAHQLTCL